jgi:protein TonB
MLWVALAAQISAAQMSAPQPTNLDRWATADDVPLRMLPEGPSFVVGFRVAVDPTGRPQSCRLEKTSGLEDLDTYTCKLVMKRARFKAASDVNGAPMYGVYASYMKWWVGERPPPPPAPFGGDLDLMVDSWPAGIKSPATIRIMFAVDAQGRPSACRSEKADAAAPLVEIACDQILRRLKPVPAVDRGGAAVSSVQDAEIRFSTK